MSDLTERLDALARLLEYPGEGHAAHVALCTAVVSRDDADAAADLSPLVEFSASSLGDCEERYVRTFDGNAERALEVGWQVFGEQYERGAFLVDLRGRMRDAGLAESTELPDHLTNILRLLPRIDRADAALLADRAVLRSVDRVVANMEPADPYRGVMTAVRRALAAFEPAAAPTGGTS